MRASQPRLPAPAARSRRAFACGTAAAFCAGADPAALVSRLPCVCHVCVPRAARPAPPGDAFRPPPDLPPPETRGSGRTRPRDGSVNGWAPGWQAFHCPHALPKRDSPRPRRCACCTSGDAPNPCEPRWPPPAPRAPPHTIHRPVQPVWPTHPSCQPLWTASDMPRCQCRFVRRQTVQGCMKQGARVVKACSRTLVKLSKARPPPHAARRSSTPDRRRHWLNPRTGAHSGFSHIPSHHLHTCQIRSHPGQQQHGRRGDARQAVRAVIANGGRATTRPDQGAVGKGRAPFQLYVD